MWVMAAKWAVRAEAARVAAAAVAMKVAEE